MSVTPLKYIIAVVLIVSSGIAGYLGNDNNISSDGFYCTANVNLHNHNKLLSAVLNYHMEDGQGFLTLSGEYYESEMKISEVSLSKQFRYREKEGEYLLSQISDGVLDVTPGDKSILENFIPDFYLSNTVPAHHIRIKNLKNGAWIFTTAPVPYFVCTDY
ncbi:hypothetical protein ROS59_000074 [Enterobacter cloacae]|nr:hypothetical protein [Enterobacter cloacae]NIH43542.1 hypothetical protein [Enterobacter asburiae]